MEPEKFEACAWAPWRWRANFAIVAAFLDVLGGPLMQSLSAFTQVRHLMAGWLHALTPHQCALCGLATPAADSSTDLCEACAIDLAPQPRCTGCALALHGPEALMSAARCGICRHQAPPWQSAWAGMDYRHPGDLLMLAYKRERQLWVARSLAKCMWLALPVPWRQGQAPFDLVTALPAHRESLRRRGFNPPGELGKRLARRLGLPFSGSALSWQRHTLRQAWLGATERDRQLANSLHAHSPRVAQRRVIVIDDVMTTGATLREATRALYAAGAVSVSVWVAARTPPPVRADDALAVIPSPSLPSPPAA